VSRTGTSAGSSCGQFGLQHAFVLVAGFAQARGQVDQAGGHDQAGGVDGAVRGKVSLELANGGDAATGDGQVANLIQA
jgi:hypothetical protein